MFNALNHNRSIFSIIFKYFWKLISMHTYCIIFPIVFFALTINIAFYIFNYELWEIKNLIINSIILITFVIPFAFLPFSLFNLTKKPIIALIKNNNKNYLKLILTIVMFFLLYYFFIFAYMLLLAVLFSINIADSDSNLINYVFKPLTKFNGTYFNNGTNWISLLFSFISGFFFLFFLGYLITIIFRKKLSLIIMLAIFLLSTFFGGVLFPIRVLDFNVDNYQWLPFVSLYLYPIILIHVSWIGFDIFTFTNILGLATEYIITTKILIIASAIVYATIFLSLTFYILEFFLSIKKFDCARWLYKNNSKWKKYKIILEESFGNVAFWISDRKYRKKTEKIVKIETKTNNKTLCYIDHIDSFIPELTFIENLEFLKKNYGLAYDFSQLNEIIELLDMYFIINKKTVKCKQYELFYLNILFALMQKPQQICLIAPSIFFSKSKSNKILNLINKYAVDNDIKIIIISNNIKELQIFTKDIYRVNSKGISSMSQEQLNKL